MLLGAVVLVLIFRHAISFRVLEPDGRTITGSYFRPYDKGFVGDYGDPTTLQRERINEGAIDTPTHELLYNGDVGLYACV